MNIEFQISASAKEQLRALLTPIGAGEQMVAVIAPEFPLPPHLRFGGEDATLNTDTSLERVSDYLRAQPKPLVSQWTVAGARKSRFPEADIHEIDGVLFYLPHDIAERVNGRVLILKAGVLQFDPPLEPLVTES